MQRMGNRRRHLMILSCCQGTGLRGGNDMKEQSGHSNCSELERIMKIMEPYIQSCPLYNIVRSDKFGYLLIAMSADDQIDDAEIIPLDSAETLLRELYTNLAYDFMQQEGHCIDYTKATALELRAMKEWMKPYTDQLPEYQYILEDILPKKS